MHGPTCIFWANLTAFSLQWTHVVATFQTGVDSKVFRNDRAHHLQDSRVTSNDGGPHGTLSEKGARLAQNMQVGPCIPDGMQQ